MDFKFKTYFCYLLFTFWSLSFSLLKAQTPEGFKVEREFKISSKKVNEEALNNLTAIFGAPAKKARWYKQEEYNTWRYEAKLEFRDEDYSVEFDTLGNLINVEVDIDWDDIAKHRRDVFKLKLTEKFGKYKIEKIQEQWEGSVSYVRKRVLSFEDYDEEEEEDDDDDDDQIRYKDYDHNYEIILIAKENGVYQAFEVIFSSKGELLRVLKVVEANIDHLTY